MFRRTLSSYLTAAAILMVAGAPLLAQDKGARPNPSGSSSSGGSGRTASGSGGSNAGSSSGGATSADSSSRSGAGSSFGPSGVNTDHAPARPERRAAPRDSSGQRPNGSNRNSDSPGGSDDQQRRAVPGASAGVSSGDASGARRAVPTYARPRDGRPAIATATERRPVVYGRNSYYGYDPYYRYNSVYNRYPYGYYYAGYGLGLGYFYDPFLWGYYSPYAYGGYPSSYGGGGGSYTRAGSRDVGGLRLKVRPLDGQVYVDGYYVGEVDSFDGNFQKLQIESGAHRVEIRADGFETVQFDVMVTSGETVTYKGDLKRIK